MDPREVWLTPYLSMQHSYDSSVIAALTSAANSAQKAIVKIGKKEGIGAIVRKAQLTQIQTVLHQVLAKVFQDVQNITAAGQHAAAARALSAGFDWDSILLRNIYEHNVQQREAMRRNLVAQAPRNVDALIIRLRQGGLPLSQQVYQSQALALGWVNNAVNNAIGRGASWKELAEDVKRFISPNVNGGVSYAAKRLARTEINNAYHAVAIQDMANKPWVQLVDWNLSKSHPKLDVCNSYAQKQYRPGSVPAKPHPQCVPAGSLISARNIRAVTKRHWDGDLINVLTSEGGPELTGTPNHPALTRRGWVVLKELVPGDELISYRSGERSSFGSNIPDYEDGPARVEDVFAAFNNAPSMTSVSMPSSAPQFHGDGSTIGNINVVGADVDLMLHQILSDYLSAENLAVVYSDLTLVSRDGSFALSVPARTSSPYGFVGSAGHGESISEGFSTHSFGSSADGNIGTPERSAYRPDTAMEDGRRLLQSLAGQVDFHRVVSVRGITSFSGHVYNLQTESGWYSANDAIIHNCFCYVVPVLLDSSQFLAQWRAGQYNDYLAATYGKAAA